VDGKFEAGRGDADMLGVEAVQGGPSQAGHCEQQQGPEIARQPRANGVSGAEPPALPSSRLRPPPVGHLCKRPSIDTYPVWNPALVWEIPPWPYACGTDTGIQVSPSLADAPAA
jgi:hypothetical protein